jgi:hypothetical protein
MSLSDDCSTPRVIRRYANRKLYDTTERRFTSLAAILELVGSGVDVVVHDHDTGIDRTEVVLSQALTQVLTERVGPSDHGGLDSSSVLTQLLRMPVWAARLAVGRRSHAVDATELRLLRSEVEELACWLDVLLLDAEA